jgi:hypothetical protein
VTEDTIEAKLAHFEMQQLADEGDGEWMLALPAATIELARLIASNPGLSDARRSEIIGIGAALLRAEAILEGR